VRISNSFKKGGDMAMTRTENLRKDVEYSPVRQPRPMTEGGEHIKGGSNAFAGNNAWVEDNI
jgi:hypothetical protein